MDCCFPCQTLLDKAGASSSGRRPEQGDVEDQLLSKQQVAPLHATNTVQGKGKSRYSLVLVSLQELPERCCE